MNLSCQLYKKKIYEEGLFCIKMKSVNQLGKITPFANFTIKFSITSSCIKIIPF